jgi:hypothetical protein
MIGEQRAPPLDAAAWTCPAFEVFVIEPSEAVTISERGRVVFGFTVSKEGCVPFDAQNRRSSRDQVSPPAAVADIRIWERKA